MAKTEARNPNKISTLAKPLAPQHDVRIRHRVGTLDVDVDFKLTARWTVLFGPSGSGKTTILRAIAGLLRPDYGRIVSTISPGTDQERSFTFVDTEAGIFLPAHRRVVRSAFQQATLFPHLTVLENIKYGMSLFVRDGWERETLNTILEDILSDFRITQLAEKVPAELSGGEAQRVNLARAFAAGGRMLMLDEPFAGFDVELRDGIAAKLLQRTTDPQKGQTLSVTHDVSEAFLLGAEVIKIAGGKVVAQGPVDQVLAEERERLLQLLNGAKGTPA